MQKSTWGHCTIDYAIWLAQHCNVGRLALFHHDPSRTDAALDDVSRCAIAAGGRWAWKCLQPPRASPSKSAEHEPLGVGVRQRP